MFFVVMSKEVGESDSGSCSTRPTRGLHRPFEDGSDKSPLTIHRPLLHNRRHHHHYQFLAGPRPSPLCVDRRPDQDPLAPRVMVPPRGAEERVFLSARSIDGDKLDVDDDADDVDSAADNISSNTASNNGQHLIISSLQSHVLTWWFIKYVKNCSVYTGNTYIKL